jgi:hypothetical protein
MLKQITEIESWVGESVIEPKIAKLNHNVQLISQLEVPLSPTIIYRL